MSTVVITPVTAFVDWNSQIHAARLPRGVSEVNLAERVLDYLGRIIGRALSAFPGDHRFDVTLRIYHGWHRGFEVTPRRKALITAAAGIDFIALSAQAGVVIRREIQFGDNLFSARESRFHQKLGCHLANTLRPALDDSRKLEEKMIDTAIASEVVDLAHRDPVRWIVVVGDDDDLVPPLFVAEGIRNSAAGRVLLVRTRPDTPFLKLAGIRYKP